jgi:hypothetical protein
MEQAGTVGKRRTIPGHDRPPLDPIVGSGEELSDRNFSAGVSLGYTVLKSASASVRYRIEIL